MVDNENLLKEDTSHIVSSVNETHKEEKKGLSHKIQVILTILASICTLYIGIYTFYIVYFIPASNEEVEKVEEDTDSIFEIGANLVNKVPYSMGKNLVYDDFGVTSFEDLDNEFLVGFLIENLDESLYNQNLSCDDDEQCYDVYVETISDLYLNYYGQELTSLPEKIVLSNGLECSINSDVYNCSGNLKENFSGKISVIETVKVNGNYMYVYETALFISNYEINDLTISYDYIALKPSEASAIAQDMSSIAYSTDIDSEIYELYGSSAYIYMHTFSIVDGEYYWLETQVVNEI